MLPAGFLTRMERLMGAEFSDFLAAYDRPRNVGLRLNPLKTHVPPDLSSFGLSPIPWAKDGFFYDPATRPGLSAYHEAGLYYLQEPSAMAPVGLLDVRPGMRVLDLCAAPGGKSTQIAAALDGSGLLVANEFNPKRAKILARNIERMAVANALVLNEHPQRLAQRFPGYFHRILVDAPCSGEGMFRKEEAAITDWSEETVAMCAKRQGEILASAAQMLCPGGRLVYSTCTFSPEENEDVISAFLKTHPDFTMKQWKRPGLPPAGLTGLPILRRDFPTPSACGHTACRGKGTLRRCFAGLELAKAKILLAKPSLPCPQSQRHFPRNMIWRCPRAAAPPLAIPFACCRRILRHSRGSRCSVPGWSWGNGRKTAWSQPTPGRSGSNLPPPPWTSLPTAGKLPPISRARHFQAPKRAGHFSPWTV